jgi:PWWP domain
MFQCRWPGQAADPEKAAEKTLAIRKPGTLLVYFFGDASYGWFQPETLAPFEPLFEQLSKVKTKQQVLLLLTVLRLHMCQHFGLTQLYLS